MESNLVCNHTSDKSNTSNCAAEVQFVCHKYDYSKIGWHEVLVPINHKKYYYNFHGSMEKSIHFEESLILGVCKLFLWWLKPRLWLVDLNYNFECNWLIQNTNLNEIDLLNCLITNCALTNCPITTWQVNWWKIGVFKPITIEETVTFMITYWTVP